MGVKSSKHSYDVEKVGHGVKAKTSIKKTDEKPVPSEDNETVIEEIISAVEKTDKAPRLSKEERQKEEDLIIAKVRGEVGAGSESAVRIPLKQEEKVGNNLDVIAVIKEEISESEPIVSVSFGVASVEDKSSVGDTNCEPQTDSVVEELQSFEPKQIKEVDVIACTYLLPVPEEQHQEVKDEKINKETSLLVLENGDHKEVEPETKVAETEDSSEHEETVVNGDVEKTPKQLYLRQILDTEQIVNGMKEKILHFSGSAEDREFSILHEELIKHIIQLDDIVFDDEEVKTERRRVIKMIQRCVQNLEKKLEGSDDGHRDSDSE